MFNRKAFTTLKVTAGEGMETPADIKRRKIRMAAIFIFLLAVVLTGIAFLLRIIWQKLYVTNDRLLFKYIRFTDTRHYSAFPSNGHADFLTILAQEGIQAGKTNLLQIDLDTVQDILKRQPLLTNIKVTKILPDTLQIDAVEHVPEAILCIKTPQGGRRRFPIAIYPQQKDIPAPTPVIVLPQELNLFCERDNTYKPWNYTHHPIPFDTRITNTTLPLLFEFNFLNPALTPGTVIADKHIASALKIIHHSGLTSLNHHFSIQNLQFVPPSTIRLTVMPLKAGGKIQTLASFDLDSNNITEELFIRLSKYLDIAESTPATTAIRYLNATGNTIYSSPNAPK
ncbi:MAG: FtsQ-type POTRA domain-containing protein [Victivallales bacterium]|nr:FtsQ-type POTRA domain-containing protein [Victivallales bacterium]